MFDINTINKRYFDISISVTDDEGKEHSFRLDVEPPKVKTLKKIIALSKNKDNEEAMSEAIRLILNKNKTNFKVSDEIIENLDIDQYKAIFNEYSKWLNEVRNSPN
ncbi:hypothetical protein EHE19_019160 [Ruminiclostridium herbifermentans]|uniref:Uncharacterized protein n=1 Tax=Ruminiclostridium herbifermentans TaxID=2488810 RepID=A0A4V6EP24_9FIRM|nr:hypothetical protein [Ruminiclostridium herbifermentans]QNU66916.1 hypothetical protein EHE19_019160 [Ruminiclostridium herbifermentans]